MKNRRAFVKTSAAGIVGSLLVSLPELSLATESNKNGIVKNPDEGETYWVRENTPITFKVSKSADGIDSISICTEEMMPGSAIPIHKHLYNDEIFFFHKGSGSFILDEKEFPVSEGSTAFVPKGVWHGLKNTGNELMILAFSFSPAGFEDFFKAIGTPKDTPFRAKPQEEINLLAKKYGMVFK